MQSAPLLAKANFGGAEVKARSAGRSQKATWMLRSLLK
jgi:hypothetical protein